MKSVFSFRTRGYKEKSTRKTSITGTTELQPSQSWRNSCAVAHTKPAGVFPRVDFSIFPSTCAGRRNWKVLCHLDPFREKAGWTESVIRLFFGNQLIKEALEILDHTEEDEKKQYAKKTLVAFRYRSGRKTLLDLAAGQPARAKKKKCNFSNFPDFFSEKRTHKKRKKNKPFRDELSTKSNFNGVTTLALCSSGWPVCLEEFRCAPGAMAISGWLTGTGRMRSAGNLGWKGIRSL